MTNYKEILRLYYAGFTQREISRSLNYSRNTIKLCINRVEAKEIKLPIAEDVSNEELHKILYVVKQEIHENEYFMPDFKALSEELKKKHVTKKLLWKEYIDSCINSGLKSYSISQFNSLFEEYLDKHNISLRRNHNPGEILELDWL